MDIFIFFVGHLVRHSNIFCQTFIKNVRLSDRSDEFRQHCKYVQGAYVSPTTRYRGGGMYKNLNLGHFFQPRSDGAFILHNSLWQDLSLSTINFDLVTLTLKFDLLLKNFNLGHIFQTRSGRAFILHMCILCDKTFHFVP